MSWVLGQTLNFHKNYVGEEKYREEFFQFTPKVLYGADFRLWHRLGFWESSYVPYSFFKNGIMVSNASVCEMQIIFIIFQRKTRS
ncbi:hypothetical protein LEP1GSC188_0673 [Leptospira weilii serovar Topaz str. LT2116]|uniref:Uncharacterized protein n=1 Tax=Leptospira weilii serovar Topaz str. LT2116 TaxID=1088540 RepID=M3EEL3_9LEPT|nr:hypothetical protein LEP1GSC188_0673 [Leptospira weilii serovar Topaz str. LT2116]